MLNLGYILIGLPIYLMGMDWSIFPEMILPVRMSLIIIGAYLASYGIKEQHE